MGIKRCPKCGSAKLLAKKTVGVQVESLENGEFKINGEGKNYQIEILGCAKCRENFDESALVEMTQCKKCGNYVNPGELDANGECEVCQALTERPNLANMSKEDLIRMMLKLEKNTGTNTTPVVSQPTTSSIAEEKMKAAQAAIENVSNSFSQEIIKETTEQLKSDEEMLKTIMNEPEEFVDTTEETSTTKRGRKPRKKTDDSTTISTEEVNNSADAIAELQEAPFPEQDSEMKEMYEQSVEAEQVVDVQNTTDTVQPGHLNSPFQMFDSEQSF